MNEKKGLLKQTVLVTVIAINLMLGSLLIVNKIVKIDGFTTAVAPPSQGQSKIDLRMKFVGKDHIKVDASSSPTGYEGAWIVEHYKEYEYHYNPRGELIQKRPTSKEENIRYWDDKNNHSY